MSKETVFGAFGRHKEITRDEMTGRQPAAYDETVEARGQVPGPYTIWLQNDQLERAMMSIGAYYQEISLQNRAGNRHQPYQFPLVGRGVQQLRP